MSSTGFTKRMLLIAPSMLTVSLATQFMTISVTIAGDTGKHVIGARAIVKGHTSASTVTGVGACILYPCGCSELNTSLTGGANA